MTGLLPDTDQLLQRAVAGDGDARAALLERHRMRLRRMVSIRFDARLAARFDPSDVVQDTLARAARELPSFLRHRPLPFYTWLRKLDWQQLVQLRRHHLDAGQRAVHREDARAFQLEAGSVVELADELVSRESSPSMHAVREEQRRRVQQALAELAERDREVLVLRFLEQLSIAEISAELGVTEAAAKMRQLRALQRLQRLVRDCEGDGT